MTALLAPNEAARLRPGEQLVIVRAGDEHPAIAGFRQELPSTRPQDWVALTGPCPTCLGVHRVMAGQDYEVDCTWCRDGRRIVPLYTECRHPTSTGRMGYLTCSVCGATSDPASGYRWRKGKRLVGRGSIEVVPVVDALTTEKLADVRCVVVWPDRAELYDPAMSAHRWTRLALDPLPVPGRDWGIVIDCVEVI